MMLNIMDIGIMTNKLGSDMNFGWTLLIILVNIPMEKKKEQEHIYGRINPNMKDNGEIIILKDMEYIISLMGEPIRENGKIKK